MPAALQLSTSWGDVRVLAHLGRIVECHIPRRETDPRTAFRVGRARIRADDPADRRVLRAADLFLRRLFKGCRSRVPPVAAPSASPFTQRAWRELQRVPAGRTISYRELARRAGSPRAFRAAGQACARNRIPLFIPCHRVLAEGGGLGGFSAGPSWKRLLLEAERSAR